MRIKFTRSGFFALLLAVGLSIGAAAQTPPSAQLAAHLQTFATPEAAAEMLTEAIRKDDDKTVAAILGAGWRDLIPGNKEEEENEVRRNYLAAWDEAHKIVLEGDKKALIQVGKTAFNMAIPVVKDGNAWRFDVVWLPTPPLSAQITVSHASPGTKSSGELSHSGRRPAPSPIR